MDLEHNPRLANAEASISPTIQTDTTSNCKSSTIPTGRYADAVKNQTYGPSSNIQQTGYIPRTIQIQPKRFAECLSGTPTNKARSDRQEEGTITTGNTSSWKTDKEIELEAKNERLEKEVQELKKGLQYLQIQMKELVTALTNEKTKDTTPQRKK